MNLQEQIEELKGKLLVAEGKFMYYLNLKCPHCDGSHNVGHK